MGTTISRWGHSLAIRLPKSALDATALREGDAVTVSADRGRLIVKPSRRLNIEHLIAAISPETLPEESFDTSPVGQEIL